MSNGTRYTKNTAKQQQACELFRAGNSLDFIQKILHMDFYRLKVALDRAGLLLYLDSEKPPDRCPCGALTGVPGQKFCSHEHRMEYGRVKQPKPENYVTFTCQNPACGKEMTRYRKYGNGTNKYCSIECSAKHNRTKQHIVVEDALVLDSPYEALFYGLCRLWKVPCDRADRSEAVAIGDGWYCPDFYLPQLQLHVETKGYQSDDDPDRWTAWREAGHLLAVVSKEALHVLRKLDGATTINRQLILWSQETWRGSHLP